MVLDLVLGNTAGYLAHHMQPVFDAMDSGELAALLPELAPALRGYQAPRPARSPLALLGGLLEGFDEALAGGWRAAGGWSAAAGLEWWLLAVLGAGQAGGRRAAGGRGAARYGA
jgi:hypothetical protein